MSKKFLKTLLVCSLLVGSSTVIFSTKCLSYGIDDEIDSSYRKITAKFDPEQLNKLKDRTIKQATWQIQMLSGKTDTAHENKLHSMISRYIDDGVSFRQSTIQSTNNPRFNDWFQIIRSAYTETILNIQSEHSKEYQSINYVPPQYK